MPARKALRRASGWKRRTPGDIRADINVTPLVDVVLVLLIIFMVVGPAIIQGTPVELPRTVHHKTSPDEGKEILVVVTRDGQVHLRANPVGVDELTRLLGLEGGRPAERKVALKADKLADYKVVREVMEAINRADIEEVRLATDERRPGN